MQYSQYCPNSGSGSAASVASLALVDPYQPAPESLERFWSMSARVEQIYREKPRISKARIATAMNGLPNRAQTSQILGALQYEMGSVERGDWEVLREKLRTTFLRRRIELYRPGDDFGFLFPKHEITTSFADWWLFLYTLEFSLKQAMSGMSTQGLKARFKNWLLSDLYVRIMKPEVDVLGCHLCVARIELHSYFTGQGLSRFVLGGLQEIALRAGVPLTIEHAQIALCAHLHRIGWLRTQDSPSCDTWIDPATVPIGSQAASHLISLWGSRSTTDLASMRKHS